MTLSSYEARHLLTSTQRIQLMNYVPSEANSVKYNMSEINNNSNDSIILPTIDYDDLVEATNNWSQNNILAEGWFGRVYSGLWKLTPVVIKRDERETAKSVLQQILKELSVLYLCRHENVVSFFGISFEGREPCVVYRLMTGGTLEQRLRNTAQPLTLVQRSNIALGTACGLRYLHTFSNQTLVHGSVKSAIILLDSSNVPKLTDFRLVSEGTTFAEIPLLDERVVDPYLPDDFLINRIFTTKLDVFSFGVVLFELATGLKAYDCNRASEQSEGNGFLSRYIQICAERATREEAVWQEIKDV